VESRLREGSLDFYIGPAPEVALARGFIVEKLFDNTRVIFARKGHPLAHATSPKELMGARWMTTGITERAGAEFEQFFAAHGLPMPPITVHRVDALHPHHPDEQRHSHRHPAPVQRISADAQRLAGDRHTRDHGRAADRHCAPRRAAAQPGRHVPAPLT
jgi:hypothetical protein